MQQDVRVRTTAQIAGHPIHPMLVPIPIACFVGALLTATSLYGLYRALI